MQVRTDELGMRDPILYTGGTFDLFHAGHASFLRKCRQIAGTVVVALNTDEFVAEFKGRAPVLTFAERRIVLMTCGYVSAVVKNIGGSDSRLAIEVVSPDVIAIGSDWKQKDYHTQMGFSPEWLEERGIGLVYLEYTKGISSTDVKQRTVAHANGPSPE